MTKFYIWLFVLIISVITNVFASHPITTLINAKWTNTPFALEVGEYLSDENPSLFWDYVELINKLDPTLDTLDNDLKQYKASVKAAEGILNPTQIPLLKLSLSLHYLSPRVQAHLQIAGEILKTDNYPCEGSSFLNVIDEDVLCDTKNLDSKLKLAKTKESKTLLETFSFDHIFPGTENITTTVVHYGEIGTKDFQRIHKVLKGKAEKGEIKYIIRHFIRTRSQKKVRLSGYGVELHLKSTEYKSQDDSPKPDSDQQTEENQKIDTEVEGFDFKTLK